MGCNMAAPSSDKVAQFLGLVRVLLDYAVTYRQSKREGSNEVRRAAFLALETAADCLPLLQECANAYGATANSEAVLRDIREWKAVPDQDKAAALVAPADARTWIGLSASPFGAHIFAPGYDEKRGNPFAQEVARWALCAERDAKSDRHPRQPDGERASGNEQAAAAQRVNRQGGIAQEGNALPPIEVFMLADLGVVPQHGKVDMRTLKMLLGGKHERTIYRANKSQAGGKWVGWQGPDDKNLYDLNVNFNVTGFRERVCLEIREQLQMHLEAESRKTFRRLKRNDYTIGQMSALLKFCGTPPLRRRARIVQHGAEYLARSEDEETDFDALE